MTNFFDILKKLRNYNKNSDMLTPPPPQKKKVSHHFYFMLWSDVSDVIPSKTNKIFKVNDEVILRPAHMTNST